MVTEAAVQDWVQLPSGISVSGDRMQRGDMPFSLYYAAKMDVAKFNKEAKKYGVCMDELDAPIDRMVKCSIFLSRRDKDGSQMFANEDYVDMLLEAAKNKNNEPIASFYRSMKSSKLDATRDILEFHGKVTDGPNKDNYEVMLWRFNDNGVLVPIEEFQVASEGWTDTLGENYKYPIKTSNNFCRIQNIGVQGLEDNDAAGYWSVGAEPEKGEQRIALRVPLWSGVGLLCAYVLWGRSCSVGGVGALRSRGAPAVR